MYIFVLFFIVATMNCYQKFYTNQIHSSSLLCQLATMWKSQVLCDAIIRSGAVITKVTPFAFDIIHKEMLLSY